MTDDKTSSETLCGSEGGECGCRKGGTVLYGAMKDSKLDRS